MSTSTIEAISQVCDSTATRLIAKNMKYGDSALYPRHTFSKDVAANAIAIRIDDKLSRISNGDKLDQDDVNDLLGYLVLLIIAKGWTNFDPETEKLGE